MIEMDLLFVLRSVVEYGPSVFCASIREKVARWRTYLHPENTEMLFNRDSVSATRPPSLVLLDDVLSVISNPDPTKGLTEEHLIAQVRRRVDTSFAYVVNRFSQVVDGDGSLLQALEVSRRFARIDKRVRLQEENLADSGDDEVESAGNGLADDEEESDVEERPTSRRRIVQRNDNPSQVFPPPQGADAVDAVDTVRSPRHLFSSQQQTVASLPHGEVDPSRDGESVSVSNDNEVAPLPNDGGVSPVPANEQGQAQIEGEECIQIDSKRRRRSRKEMEGVTYVKNRHVLLAQYKNKRRPVVRQRDRLQEICEEVMASFADVVVSDELMKEYEEPDFGDGDNVHDSLSFYCDFQVPSDVKQYRLVRGDTKLADRICTWVREVKELMGFDEIAAIIKKSVERVRGIKKELADLDAVGAASVKKRVTHRNPRPVRCMLCGQDMSADFV